jgi:hypothetical protein
VTIASSTDLITTLTGQLGVGVLAVLTVVLGLALAYIVFKFGWRKLRGAIRG